MDNGSESLAHDGPSCPMSEQCVRMLDILDDMRDGFPPGWDDDAQLAEQLFEHLQTCPICTAAVARARAAREWQRQALRALLADGEQAVPSTTSRIMAAIAREREPVATTTAAVRPQEPLSPLPLQKRPVSRRPRSAFGGGRFLLAAVATVVIVAALSIFSYLTAFQPGPASRSRVTPTPTSPLFTRLPVSTDWSSVVAIGSVRSGDMQTVENYDPASGKHVPLLSGCCSRDTIVDGIAHNGGDLIYHRYDSTSQETTYYSLLGRSYVVQGRGTNAVWSTDDSSIFVGTSKQVIQITIKDATQKALKKPLHADLLAFYRSNFLYFIRSQPGNTYNLYRIDLRRRPRVRPAGQLLAERQKCDLVGDHLLNGSGPPGDMAVGRFQLADPEQGHFFPDVGRPARLQRDDDQAGPSDDIVQCWLQLRRPGRRAGILRPEQRPYRRWQRRRRLELDWLVEFDSTRSIVPVLHRTGSCQGRIRHHRLLAQPEWPGADRFAERRRFLYRVGGLAGQHLPEPLWSFQLQ